MIEMPHSITMEFKMDFCTAVQKKELITIPVVLYPLARPLTEFFKYIMSLDMLVINGHMQPYINGIMVFLNQKWPGLLHAVRLAS